MDVDKAAPSLRRLFHDASPEEAELHGLRRFEKLNVLIDLNHVSDDDVDRDV
eukprot:CAMPEP_0194490256 /NCGR_PEP_ID=MMETSP0253-20130528/9538_1 /TAXON_ID=2966 /ORGANISM="Noctiluca scintillans" /LENGTH=51 /DNA_ID=CAMNT_0039330865 /DNA_START=735 /DNA_END=890 /DNA_ORIENTATION=-